MPLTIGTAGHIDHGKTWLVRALTGKDTDRLPEEQQRGISIDLGYAPLELPDGRTLSVVDVPGHERFVRNMVAGATGIDLFLLVVDAAEGARPQTHEHLAILRLLGIGRGVVAVTKSDAVDEETLQLALAEVHELVPEAEAVAVSAKTGEGLDELRAALARIADAAAEAARPEGPARLYVDRVFTLHGIGTVVTGTLWSGTLGEGDVLRIEPSGLEARVRSVQVHDRPVKRAESGQRVAVALPGVERDRISRGDALVEAPGPPVTYRLDVALEELEEVPAAVTVHLGTADVPARLVRQGRYAQLRLGRPLVAARGDRVVLRTRSTVGGGIVLDPLPPRGLDPERLERIERGEAGTTVYTPVRAETLSHLGELAGVERAGEWVFASEWLEELRDELRVKLSAADPRDPGIDAPAAPWAPAIVPLLGLERRGSRLYLPGSTALAEGADELLAELDASGFVPVKIPDARLARVLEQEGRIVRVGSGEAIGAAAYEQARAALVEECTANGKITLARFRDLLGTGRRPAQLLLERFDADGITRRVGDERVLRRAAR
jgi:selenocysteine-specific elongation factor